MAVYQLLSWLRRACQSLLPGLWLLVVCARAAQPDAQILVQASPVAGFQYYAGKSVWHAMREGDRLTLVREPDNAHDARAIRIEWHGRQLGYVPRRDNAALARLMDRGATVVAYITRLTPSHNPWQRVLFEVYEPLP